MSDIPQSPLNDLANADGSFSVGKTSGIDGFVSLQVRCTANRIDESFPIGLVLEVDEWRLRIERPAGLLHRVAGQLFGQGTEAPAMLNLRVRLRHCYVRYQCDGVSITAASKYRSAIEVGTYSEKEAASERSGSTSDRAINVGAGVSAGLKSKASIDGTYRVGSRWQGSSTVERTIAASQDIYEVEAVPGGWRIGDKSHGDPLKRDGCLDGPYFSRPVEGRGHSCDATFLPDSSHGSIRFDVTAHDGLYVDVVTAETTLISERDVAISAMRNRLAAICIEQANSETGELVLLTVEATCIKAEDLPADVARHPLI